MISPVATKNRHIELLQSMAYDSNTTIDCLLVAHNNALLAERLEMAFSDKSAALLQVPQGNWDLKNGDLAQAIGWAIEECHVQRIVLVGDSSASVSDRRAKLLGITEAGPRNLGLFDRVQRAEGLRKQARDQFLEQLQTLLNTPEIASRVANGQLIVNGLFYRSEAGVFTMYDEHAESFVLLHQP